MPTLTILQSCRLQRQWSAEWRFPNRWISAVSGPKFQMMAERTDFYGSNTPKCPKSPCSFQKTACSFHSFELILSKRAKKKSPENRLFTGLFGGELGIRTLGSFWEHSISSAAPSTTRTTLRVCNSAFLPKTFGKNWRKEQQNIQFSNRRKPWIYGLFKRSKQPTLEKISSQSRYDRFDTFPYSAKAWKNTLCAYYFIGFERKSQAFFGKKVDIYRAKRLQ